jgi:Mor family transcriptional regulator
MEKKTRLTHYDHDEIRASYEAGIPLAQLAAEYGLSILWIRAITRRAGAEDRREKEVK